MKNPLLSITKAEWDVWQRENENPGPRRQTPEHRARQKAAVRAALDKKREILKRACARTHVGRYAVVGKAKGAGWRTLDHVERFWAAVEPDCWYSAEDMGKLSKQVYRAAKTIVANGFKTGLLQRCENPDWIPPGPHDAVGGNYDGIKAQKRSPDDTNDNPRFLYMLTPAGMNRRALAKMVQ